MAVPGVGCTAPCSARAAYLQGGLDLALFDMARPGRPRKYDTAVEAQVSALACSTPPAGHKRWTVVELQQAGHAQSESRDDAPLAQTNDLKPRRRLMWCIGELTL